MAYGRQAMTTATHDPKLRPGSAACRCASCGLYFAGLKGFDRHRTGPYLPPGARRCRTLDEMAAMGYVMTDTGHLSYRGMSAEDSQGTPGT